MDIFLTGGSVEHSLSSGKTEVAIAIEKGDLKVKTHLNLIATAVVMLAILVASTPAVSQRGGNAGKAAPDMKGPAPRLPNGKPSMAGIWSQTRRADVTDSRLPGFVKELPFTAWGKQQWETYNPAENGDYAGSCLPFGMSRSIFGPHPLQIVQDNDYLVMLFEQNTWFHIIPTDGRPFDKELPPTWFGESVGHWEGDTLVIETRNINGYPKVDTIGHPLSNQARLVQTFKRVDFGHIEHTFTYDDPKTYTKPWTVYNTWPLEPWGTKIMEYSCEEGNEGLFDGSIKRWRPPADPD